MSPIHELKQKLQEVIPNLPDDVWLIITSAFTAQERDEARASLMHIEMSEIGPRAETIRQLDAQITALRSFIERYVPARHSPDCIVMCGPGAPCDCDNFAERRELLAGTAPLSSN